MSRLFLCGLTALALLCGCATIESVTYKEGNYRLIALSDNARPVDIAVVHKLSDSGLEIAGVRNS